MFGVALIAANLAAHRQMDHFLFPDVVPTLDLLVIAAYLVIGRGGSHPILLGSLSFGWIAALAFVVIRVWFYGSIRSFHQQGESALRSFWFDYVAITGAWSNNHWSELRAFFRGVTFFLPQFLFALVGGGIAWRLDRSGDRELARSHRTMSKVVGIAAVLAMALVVVTILASRAEDLRWMVRNHAASEQHNRAIIPMIERAVADLETDPVSWVVQDRRDPRVEIARLRAWTEEARQRAECHSELKRKYERAARQPWWPVVPDPPPPSGP